MENEIIFLVEEAPEGGYTARALGHNIFTEADSFAELKRMAQDATQCHFEAEKMPRLIHLHNHPHAQISQGRHPEQYRERHCSLP
jgi:predicted RNase H-like HicB family nuclease